MNKHHVDGRLSLHALQGNFRIRMPEKLIELSHGDLCALDYGIPHSIEAVEESAFLLTISWPGGTKEERHAWKQSVS
jgi:quercetin dioxygenase-like cupin family protein